MRTIVVAAPRGWKLFAVVAVAMALSTSPLFAESRSEALGAQGGSAAVPPHPVVAESAPDFRFESLAVGLAAGWQLREEFGTGSRSAFSPELLVHGTFSTHLPRTYLRLGARLGHLAEQAESPSQLTLEEFDTTAFATVSLYLDWVVLPALTVGAGVLLRTVDLMSGPSVDSSASRIDRHQALFASFLQLSVGLPIEDGVIVLEPFARYEIVPSDARLASRFGMDLTVAF